MTEAKARRMGFVKLEMWEGYFPGEWCRSLKRPQCNEYWNPLVPDKIKRVTWTSPYARSTVTRHA